MPIGAITLKGIAYSVWAPASFRPLGGFINDGPDPTGTLDMRLEGALDCC